MSFVSHESAKSMSVEWHTPPEILDALDVNDWYDPCHKVGLDEFVVWPNEPIWLNPPYRNMQYWMGKIARHNNGIALVFARTDTGWFFDSVWGGAYSLLFLRGRLRFIKDGKIKAKHNAGAPSVLVAYGQIADERLTNSGIDGKYVRL